MEQSGKYTMLKIQLSYSSSKIRFVADSAHNFQITVDNNQFFVINLSILHDLKRGLLCKAHIMMNSRGGVTVVSGNVFIFVHMTSCIFCC